VASIHPVPQDNQAYRFPVSIKGIVYHKGKVVLLKPYLPNEKELSHKIPCDLHGITPLRSGVLFIELNVCVFFSSQVNGRRNGEDMASIRRGLLSSCPPDLTRVADDMEEAFFRKIQVQFPL